MKAVSFEISFPTTRAIMRWFLAAFFVAGGVAHLAVPGEFLKITPDWVPFAPQVILVTGFCEIAGALALVTKPLRSWAGIALAVYAVCVWPANFKHAFGGVDIPHLSSSWWDHAPRLALQPGDRVVGAVLLGRHRLAFFKAQQA